MRHRWVNKGNLFVLTNKSLTNFAQSSTVIQNLFSTTAEVYNQNPFQVDIKIQPDIYLPLDTNVT